MTTASVRHRRQLTVAAVSGFLFLLTAGLVFHGRGDDATFSPDATFALPPCTARTAGIPRRLHQMWKNTTIPAKWLASQRACRRFNADYEYYLWTDEHMERFIAAHYPWFLATYHSYPYPIQKVDAARYFILYHYGGVYVDLDLECRFSFDHVIRNISSPGVAPGVAAPAPVGRYEVILAGTTPAGVTNAVMMVRQCSAFFRSLLLRLPRANRRYGLPYPTVMLSTGPLFLTLSLSGYPRAARDIYTVSEFQYHHVLFHHGAGSSWHTWDGRIIRLVNHRAVYAAAAVVAVVVWLRRRRQRRSAALHVI